MNWATGVGHVDLGPRETKENKRGGRGVCIYQGQGMKIPRVLGGKSQIRKILKASTKLPRYESIYSIDLQTP